LIIISLFFGWHSNINLNYKKNFSTEFKQKNSLNNEFKEWLCGLIDGVTKHRAFSSSSYKRKDSHNVSLVVWGKILPSQVGQGKISKQESNMIKLPSYQYSVVVGILLSDAWLTFSTIKSKNTRLWFEQSMSNYKYCLLVFSILSTYCSSIPNVRNKVSLGTKVSSIYFFTRSLPCLTELHYVFYRKGIKIVPENMSY